MAWMQKGSGLLYCKYIYITMLLCLDSSFFLSGGTEVKVAGIRSFVHQFREPRKSLHGCCSNSVAMPRTSLGPKGMDKMIQEPRGVKRGPLEEISATTVGSRKRYPVVLHEVISFGFLKLLHNWENHSTLLWSCVRSPASGTSIY